MGREIYHPAEDEITLEGVLSALGDATRLEIVRMADAEPGTTCGVFIEEIPKSTMSHHWKVLREAGVIRQEAEGRTRRNSVRRAELDRLFPGLLDAVLRVGGG